MNFGALTRASRPLLVANVVLVGLALFFGVSLVREFSRARSVPAPKAHSQQAVTAAKAPDSSAGANDRLDSYNVIVAKHLFNPARTENAAVPTAAAAAPPLVKPLLHGVILDGAQSFAYLEDPGSKRVLVYRVGDPVAGGKLVQISEDRVSISRADAQVEVLLKDPGKPQPAPTGAQPAQPALPARASRGTNPGNPAPVQPPAAVQGVQSQGPVRVPRILPTPSESSNPPEPAPAQE